MKSTFALSLLAGTVAAADFSITYLYTKQPTGNPDGQTNYYVIAFNVTLTDSNTTDSAFCWTNWGDNVYTSNDAFSDNVPTGSWLQCAHNSSNINDKTSDIAFQLSPFFSIGNFSVALQQTVSQTNGNGLSNQTIVESDLYHITNTTAAFTCTINPEEVPSAQVHASGECTTPANSTGFTIPVVSTTTPTCSSNITLSFPVQELTAWGDNVFVVGNLTELGNWDPYNAVALSASQYTDSNTLWTGGNVSLAPGTAFEYKYVQWSADGTLQWECDENRVFTMSEDVCSTETAGNDPDYFRCGNH